MPQKIKLWSIGADGQPLPAPQAKLDLEDRLEDWIVSDSTIVADNLLVFGRQVETDHGGIIDLLCLDDEGDVVIVELKRGRTPRDVTAQTIDYASWVRNISNEDIHRIAAQFFKSTEALEVEYRSKFGTDLPEVLNDSHRMLIVGTGLDSATERIIEYLSDAYGVDINAITFGYFRGPDDSELVARVFLLEPDRVEYKARTRSTSKRAPNLTFDELENSAHNAGVIDIYRTLVSGLEGRFQKGSTRSSLSFRGKYEDSQVAILSLLPGDSSSTEGLKFQIYFWRFCVRVR